MAYLAAFVVLGLASTIAGPALSYLRRRAGTDDAGIGLVFVGQSLGYIAGSLVSGRLVDRGGGHRWWSAALIASAAGVGVLALMRSLPAMFVVFVFLGVAFGGCDVSGNTIVVWSRPDGTGPLLNGLHLCFAVGALLSPLLVNRALAWSGSLWPVAVPLAVIVVWCVAAMSLREAPVRTRVPPATPPGARRSARTGQLAAICLFFLLYVGVEAGFAGWIHSYVEQIGDGGANTATGVTAIFWTGFVCGRVAAIRIARRVTAAWMLAGSMSAMLVSAVALVAFAGPGAWLWLATFLYGLSIAPQFAAMIAFAEAHLTLSGGSTAAFIAASGVGGLTIPFLLGRLFDTHGAGVLPPVVLIGSVAVAASTALIAWMLLGGRSAHGQGLRHRPPATSTKAPVT